jgi:hypothetical protein
MLADGLDQFHDELFFGCLMHPKNMSVIPFYQPSLREIKQFLLHLPSIGVESCFFTFVFAGATKSTALTCRFLNRHCI